MPASPSRRPALAGCRRIAASKRCDFFPGVSNLIIAPDARAHRKPPERPTRKARRGLPERGSARLRRPRPATLPGNARGALNNAYVVNPLFQATTLMLIVLGADGRRVNSTSVPSADGCRDRPRTQSSPLRGRRGTAIAFARKTARNVLRAKGRPPHRRVEKRAEKRTEICAAGMAGRLRRQAGHHGEASAEGTKRCSDAG